MAIKKINNEPVEFELEGNVKFTLAGYDTVEQWIDMESESNLKGLLADIVEQLKKD